MLLLQPDWNKYGTMSVAEIPDRLKANGRAEDQVFTLDEKLFRRFRSEHYLEGQLTNVGLPLSNPPSTNRSKFSLAEDVLISEADEFLGQGVLSWTVQDIPNEIAGQQFRVTMFPRHMPEANNYAHTELWCDRVPQTGAHVVPSKQAKKLIRAILSQRARIEIPATV
jgi:hypothetical protein